MIDLGQLLNVPSHPDAPCVQHGGGLWFGRTAAERRNARLQCNACPILQECRAGALERGERWGVWGGIDLEDVVKHAPARAKQQAAGRTPRTVPACGTPQGAKAHYRRAEKPCEPCRLAHNAYQAELGQRRRQTA